MIAEHRPASATFKEYAWLGDMPLATVDATTSPSKLYYVHVDHLDRPATMTDATKAVVWKASYEPFGAVRSIIGSAALDLRFPGQWFQLEAGLAYNWNRHYDPTLGRYIQPDPMGFVDGPSVYAYAGLSPMMWTDPSGLSTAGDILCGMGLIPCEAPVLACPSTGDFDLGLVLQTRKTGKEKSSDIPSWAEGEKPYLGESGKDYAKRLLDRKYGPGNYPEGPGSELNKLRKYGDRNR